MDHRFSDRGGEWITDSPLGEENGKYIIHDRRRIDHRFSTSGGEWISARGEESIIDFPLSEGLYHRFSAMGGELK